MSIEIQTVQALRVYSESTFGADSSGSIGSFTYVPLREGTAQLTLTRDSLDPGQLVQHIDEYRKEVLGRRRATLAITLNLAPTGTAAGASTAAVQGAVGKLLKMCLGGENLGTGTTFTGGTATVPTVTSASGFAVGGAIGWTNASGVLETREIKSISGSSITLKHAFSGAPSNTNPAYAAATYYGTADPTESIACLVEGLESDDRWLLVGGQCVGGIQINIDVTGAQLPSITFNLTFASWYASNETGSSITGTLSAATYTNYDPIVGEAGDFRVFTCGSPTLVTGSSVHVSAITYAPAVSYVPYTSPQGTQTIKRWKKARNAPAIQGSFMLPYEDTTYFAARNSRTNKAVFYQYGSAAGDAVLLSAPTVQYVNPQRAPDASGIAAQTVPWKGRRDTDTSGSSTDLALAPYRIHLF